MNAPLSIPPPDLLSLFAEFPPADDLPDFELLPPEAVPAPFSTLLVHEHHMTVTVEAHHGDLVDVRVLARSRRDPYYSRKIILTTQKSGQVVLFGIVRINLDFCSPEVREKIVAEQTPLGRILIEHNVLRRIEPTAFFRVDPGPKQLQWFNRVGSRPMYGRLGIIHCDEQPAVELLEIVIAD
jgi:hypothetical protein